MTGDESPTLAELLEEQESCARVTEYELQRHDDKVLIAVYKAVSGPIMEGYVAMPKTHRLRYVAWDHFAGRGTSETTALRDCLLRIRGKSVEDLFPPKALRREADL